MFLNITHYEGFPLVKVLTCFIFFAVFFFLFTGSDHTTSWDDARGLCEKDTQTSHKRSGC